MFLSNLFPIACSQGRRPGNFKYVPVASVSTDHVPLIEANCNLLPYFSLDHDSPERKVSGT